MKNKINNFRNKKKIMYNNKQTNRNLKNNKQTKIMYNNKKKQENIK